MSFLGLMETLIRKIIVPSHNILLRYHLVRKKIKWLTDLQKSLQYTKYLYLKDFDLNKKTILNWIICSF